VEGYSWGISWKWGIILPEWAGKEFGFSKKNNDFKDFIVFTMVILTFRYKT